MEKDFSREKINAKRKELDKLKENLRIKLDNSSQEKLETFLEAQTALKRGSFWFIQRQIDKLKKELKKKLSNEEIENICQFHGELNKLIFVVEYPNPKRGEIYWIIFDGENVGTEVNGKKKIRINYFQ